jgi:hypothetical protein
VWDSFDLRKKAKANSEAANEDAGAESNAGEGGLFGHAGVAAE